VLRRFGIPDHHANVIIRLHEKAMIKVKIGNVEEKVGCSIGVRQGSCEGSVLFLFIMQAAMEMTKWPVPKPQFRTRASKPGVIDMKTVIVRTCASICATSKSLFTQVIVASAHAILEKKIKVL
jgi:hypothetical protein